MILGIRHVQVQHVRDVLGADPRAYGAGRVQDAGRVFALSL